jgi:transcriptional regulator with XRE-family HTH domain
MLIDYLNKELKRRKRKNKSYSIRAFAKSLNIDPSVLAKILIGKRKLSFSTAKRIINSLNVDESVKNILLLTYTEINKKFFIDEDYFVPDESISAELMGKWEYYTILSYIEIDNSFDIPLMAANVGTDEATVKAIIDNLLKLEVIKIDKGLLILTGKNLTTPKSFNEDSVKKAKRENIEKAISALENKEHSIHSDFSGFTISINSKKLKEASERIKVFRRALAEFLNDPNEKEDSVYRLNIEFFPLVLCSHNKKS